MEPNGLMADFHRVRQERIVKKWETVRLEGESSTDGEYSPPRWKSAAKKQIAGQ